jgi:hypothetical protein
MPNQKIEECIKVLKGIEGLMLSDELTLSQSKEQIKENRSAFETLFSLLEKVRDGKLVDKDKYELKAQPDGSRVGEGRK